MWTDRLSLVLLLSGALIAPVGAQPPGTPPPTSGVEPVDDEPLADPERRSFFSSSLTLGPARDSGFLVAGEELDDTVYIASPTLLFVRHPSERTGVTIAYAPELQYFQDHDGLDSVEHVAGALFQHATSRRSGVLLGGSFLDGEDPGRHMGGDLLIMPRAPYRQWRAFAGFDYRWSRTFFLLNVGRTSTRVESAAGALASDQTDDALTLTLGRDLGPRTHLSTSYSVLDPSFEGIVSDELLEDDLESPDPLPRFEEPVHTLTVGLGFQSSPNVGWFVNAGGLYHDDDTRFIGGAEVARSGKAFSFRLGYDRAPLSLAPSVSSPGSAPGQPIAPSVGLRNAVSDTLTGSFQARLHRKLRWEQSAWGSRTDLPGDSTIDSYALTSRLVLEIAERFGTFVQYQILDQDGPELLGGSISRNHLFGGVILGLTGPPGTWGIREEPESLRTILPNRRDL